jgi:hypothetical protein
MAQTNFTPISLYYSTTAAAVPTAGNLVAGELAINTQDGKLFYKDAAGVVQTIASKDVNSGTFTNISVSGVASFADGTVSLPSITNIGDTNTGMYFPAADTIAFSEGGVESMRIDASGNLGIGTSSPAAPLDVVSNSGATGISIRGRSSDGIGVLRFYTNNGATQNAFIQAYGTEMTIGMVQNAPMTFYTNNTERMRIDNSGNVGIGTSSPGFKLHTEISSTTAYTTTSRGNVATFVNYASGGTGNYAGIELQTSGDPSTQDSFLGGINAVSTGNGVGALTFYTRNGGGASWAERMRINSLGNLGLGTTAPSSISANYTTLDIRGSAGGGMLMGITGSTHTYMYTDSGGSNMFTNDAIPLQFGTNNGERMRITSGGELLIGATSNATPTSSTSMAVLQSNFRNGGTYGMGMSFNSTGATGADHYYISFNTGTTTQRGYIYYNNGAGQVQLSATSDARLKENIVDAPSILPILDQVKVRQYDWKDTGNTNIGFVAQELYDVIPRAVAVGEDNENGSIKRVWGVDNGTLVPYLVKAIQELNAKITALENK